MTLSLLRSQMRAVAARGPRPAWVMSGGNSSVRSAAPQAACLSTSRVSSSPPHDTPQAKAAAAAASSPSSASATAAPGHQAVVDSWAVNCQGLTANLEGAREAAWWFTGKAPAECAGLGADGCLRSLAQPNLATCTRAELREYFDNCWTLTEVLFAGLQGEEPFYRPPYHNLRHPKIFYYAHPASLYVNKFRVAGLLDAPINEYYEHIFETGVDEMQWDDLSKNDMLWPSVAEVKDYRQKVYDMVVDVIENHPAFDTLATQLDKSPFWAVVMGTEHEKIHLETSSVLMRELPINLVRKPEGFPDVHPSAANAPAPSVAPQAGEHYPVNELLPVEAGTVDIGKPHDFPSYGWDNEYGHKQMHVKSFKATKFLISNGEFLEFVKSGGYLDESLWESDGWKWRCFRNVKWPTFWKPVGPAGLHQYRLRSTFEEIDMPWNWPAVVNYHEAKAFANWRSDRENIPREKGYRLTTEGESLRMLDETAFDESLGVNRDPGMAYDGSAMPEKAGYNLNLAYGSESPVDALPSASTGFHDTMGNVWRWQEDHLSALPGFRVHPYYNDFTLPCFDGQHHLIRGGSYMSCGDEASLFARFHFRPHFFQHAGFRLTLPNQADPALLTSCMDNQGPYVGSNPFRSTKKDEAERKYAADETLRQHIHLHYDSQADPNMPQEARDYVAKTARLLTDAAAEVGAPMDRVLDLGCGVGGISFELARSYARVLGIDVSATFIETAQQIQEEGSRPYYLIEEGEIKVERVAKLPPNVDAARVEFKQADAMCLAPDLGAFDAVLVANMIDRLPAPASLLARLGGPRGLVRPGGILAITSPFSWQQRFTPRDLWLGGHETNEGDVRSVDTIKKTLAENFELLHEQEIPLALREHARKYDYALSHASVWRHKK